MMIKIHTDDYILEFKRVHNFPHDFWDELSKGSHDDCVKPRVESELSKEVAAAAL